MTIEDRKARKEAIENKSKIDKRRSKVLEQDLRDILNMPQGRRFINALLQKCNTFGNSYTESPHTTAYRCGVQSVGMDLYLNIMSIDDGIMKKVNDSWHEMEIKIE